MLNKKIISIVVFALVSMSFQVKETYAQHRPYYSHQWRHGGGHYVWRPGYGWVIPAIIGGFIVYEFNKPQPQTVIIQNPPANVPPPVVVPISPPSGYHWEAILDANCNCYRTVLVQN